MTAIWPFPPQFKFSGYRIERGYKTEIITSRAGGEQRRALRDTARKRIEYAVRVDNDCRREFDAAMVSSQRAAQLVPERVRFVSLTAALAVSGTVATVDSVPAWIQAGAQLILMTNRTQESVTVQSVTGSDVTFSAGVANAWAIGARLHPALTCYLDDTIKAPLVSRGNDLIEPALAFEIMPGVDTAEDTGTAAATFDGREVFLTRPNKFDPVDIDRNQDGRGRVDFGFGRISFFFPVTFSTRIWTGQYIACDFSHYDTVRALFDRMKGRRGEFFMPTWQNDLPPVSGIISGQTTLTVTGTGVAANYSGSTIYAAVAVILNDGTNLFNLVSGSITSSGGNSIINLSTAWSQSATNAEIEMVCWLPLWRFASDTLRADFPRVDLAQMKLPLQMLEYKAAE